MRHDRYVMDTTVCSPDGPEVHECRSEERCRLRVPIIDMDTGN